MIPASFSVLASALCAAVTLALLPVEPPAVQPPAHLVTTVASAPASPDDLAEFEVRDEFLAGMQAQQCETDMDCVAQCLPTARTAAEREFCFSF